MSVWNVCMCEVVSGDVCVESDLCGCNLCFDTKSAHAEMGIPSQTSMTFRWCSRWTMARYRFSFPTLFL